MRYSVHPGSAFFVLKWASEYVAWVGMLVGGVCVVRGRGSWNTWGLLECCWRVCGTWAW